MQKRSMLLLLLLLFINCHPEEEELLEVNFAVHSANSETSRTATDANRIRVKNIEALRKLPIRNGTRKEVTVLGYYEPHDGGGGVFVWNSESTENDNGGTVIVAELETGRWYRIYKDTINVKWFGAREAPDFDNASILQTVINTSRESNEIIKIEGRYRIDTTIYLDFIDGLTIVGETGSEVYTMEVMKLFSAKGKSFLRNFSIHNMKFSNYAESSKAFFDLFYFEEVCLDNIRFEFCQFTAPKINSNAIKFINQENCMTENILFSNCEFYELGRMGVEIQNHNYLKVQVRYKNIKILRSSFSNLGLQSFGMGISVSGKGEDFIAEENRFAGYAYSGIEIVGCSNNVIRGNTFSGGEGAGIRMSGEIRMFNTHITSNGNTSEDGGDFVFYNTELLYLKDNIFKTAGYYKFKETHKVQVSGGKLESRGVHTVYIENSKDCLFSHTSLDNSLSVKNYAVFRMNGDSSNVQIWFSELKKGSGGVYVDSMNGAEYPIIGDLTFL